MALRDLTRKLTYEDYALLPEDGRRHEILDGEHHVTAAPFLWHQRIALRLGVHLEPFVRRNRLGEVRQRGASVRRPPSPPGPEMSCPPPSSRAWQSL